MEGENWEDGTRDSLVHVELKKLEGREGRKWLGGEQGKGRESRRSTGRCAESTSRNDVGKKKR